jgi:hypothetical protein
MAKAKTIPLAVRSLRPPMSTMPKTSTDSRSKKDPKSLAQSSATNERRDSLAHSWVALQCVPLSASARDIEQFLEGVSLCPPLDTSPHDGMLAIFRSLGEGQEETMDVYVKCQTISGAHVASLRSNEPLMIANQSTSRPVTVRTNLPLCEIYWAHGVGVHLCNKRSGKMVLESYLNDFKIPRSLLVFSGASFQSHTHSALFRLLNPSLHLKAEKPKKRKRDLGRSVESHQEDRLTEELSLLSGRNSCAMVEAQFGYLSGQTDGSTNADDPLEIFLGPGISESPSDASILPNLCTSCALLLRDLEALLTALSNIWTMLFIHSNVERSPQDFLSRYWQSYAGLYKFLLKEFHRKGRLASCSAHR